MKIGVAQLIIPRSPATKLSPMGIDRHGLKRAALLFDRIIPFKIYEGSYAHSSFQDQCDEELRWLESSNVILNFKREFSGEFSPEETFHFTVDPSEAVRALSKKPHLDVAAFSGSEKSQFFSLDDGSKTVLQVVLNQIPLPDDSTPWEAIIEWRNDPDARKQLRRLKRWMRKIATESESPTLIQEELLYLLDEYNDHLTRHKLKTTTSVLQSLLSTTAEIAGNLASFKWGTAVENLFILRKRRIDLLEAEHTAPGREVAYIANITQAFKK
jgi:hypothetical protein